MKTFAGLLCVAVLCPYFCVRRSSLIFFIHESALFYTQFESAQDKKFRLFSMWKTKYLLDNDNQRYEKER